MIGRVRGTVRTALLATAVVLGMSSAPIGAHEFTILDAVVVVEADGTWHADLRVDVDALALGASPATPSVDVARSLAALDSEARAAAIERARTTIERRVRVRFDGAIQRPDVTFPEHGTPQLEASPEPTVFGTLARLEGTVPAGSLEVTFFASRSFGPVRLTVFDQIAPGTATFVLGAGEESPVYTIGSAGEIPDGGPRAPAFATYLGLGFEHIVPRGLDHILFMLGLFLLGRHWRPLLIQVSAFTVAHTATLALAMTGVLSQPSAFVEPAIALSIAWIAFENVATERLHPWRPAIVFGFGLLHGLGFARALAELGLPRGGFVPALVGFNVGVELGQLAVVASAFLTVGWWRNHPMYRRRVVVPASLVIGFVGLYWAIERIGLVG